LYIFSCILSTNTTNLIQLYILSRREHSTPRERATIYSLSFVTRIDLNNSTSAAHLFGKAPSTHIMTYSFNVTYYRSLYYRIFTIGHKIYVRALFSPLSPLLIPAWVFVVVLCCFSIIFNSYFEGKRSKKSGVKI
jgi:hypothetical protein